MPSGLGVALNMVDLDSGPEDIHHRGAKLCLGGDGVRRPRRSGGRGRNGKRGSRRRGSWLGSRGRGSSGRLGLARVGVKVHGRGILAGRSGGILVVIGNVVVIGRLVFLECGRRCGRGRWRGRRSWRGGRCRRGGRYRCGSRCGRGCRCRRGRRCRCGGRCRCGCRRGVLRERWFGRGGCNGGRSRSGRERGNGTRGRFGPRRGRCLGADERNLARAKGGRHGGIENRLHVCAAEHQANERTARGQAKRQGRAVVRQRGHVKQQSAARWVALDDAIDDALPRTLEIASSD